MNRISENQAIRKAARENGVRLWELAERISLTEFTLSRKLRHELPDTDKAFMLSAIQEIAAEKAEKEVC